LENETRDRVPLEYNVLSNVYTQEAIITLLEKKELITKKGVLKEMKRLMEYDKERRG